MAPLSREQVQAFYTRGYVVLKDLFDRQEIAVMRESFDRLERIACLLGRTQMFRGSQFVVERVGNGSGSHVRIDRIVWCGAAEPVLSELGRDPRLVAVAAQLLGSRSMSQLINQAHFKLPGDGVHFPWHQDSTHRRYGTPEWRDVNGRGSYVQTILALDDVTLDNGPLEILPGSCLLGHLGLHAEGALPPGIDPISAVAATMRAGSVLCFGPYTIHRSLPNRSERPRRVLINGFASPGANARVYPGDGAGRTVRLDGPPPAVRRAFDAPEAAR
jgi:ectoine hydroxylase-related dioxygenase (phytanoyl-CoA dioxygenase family)